VGDQRFASGITADYDAAPDIEALAAGIENGVAQLVRACRHSAIG
jgi:diacylglycerol O-acyltransferase / wax synthase